MRIAMWFLVALLAADFIGISAWTLVRLCSNSAGASPSELSPLLVAAGVLVALSSFAYTRAKDASKDYLDTATDLLQKAYECLAPKNPGDRPPNIRMNWLTAARLLLQAQQISEHISEPQHKRIWANRKEYWRGKLRDLIQPDQEGFPEEYYAEKVEHFSIYSETDREPLSLTSISVLYHFVQWPEGVHDPLKGQPTISKEEADKWEAFGPRGLGRLMVKYHDARSRARNGA